MTIRQQVERICTCLCRQTELYGTWAKRHGMSYNTAMTLYALDQDLGQTQRQIAQDWLLPKQTVNTVVKDLERRGLVVFESGKDQKEKVVRLTAAGKRFAAENLGELYALEERAMAAVGAKLAAALTAGTVAFTEAFEKEVYRGS